MSVLANPARLTPEVFRRLHAMLEHETGIHLADIKRPLMAGRLARRLAAHGLDRFEPYLQLVLADADERQQAVDCLTTNETCFFREMAHFELLAHEFAPRRAGHGTARIWCAASSTGEEAYSIAATLAHVRGPAAFEVLGSDISTRVLETARRALYPVDDARELPAVLRRAYCLRGSGEQREWFTFVPALRRRVSFEQINLVQPLPDIGEFDAIFLRNVMIYFSQETRRAVVQRLLPRLKPGGLFFVSHSETLNGLGTGLRMLRPSVYRKAGGEGDPA